MLAMTVAVGAWLAETHYGTTAPPGAHDTITYDVADWNDDQRPGLNCY